MTRVCVWNVINFVENYPGIFYITNLSKHFPFTQISVGVLCRFSGTGIIMTSHKSCMWPTKPCTYILKCMFLHRPLRKFVSKYQLCNASKPTYSCHQGPLGYVPASKVRGANTVPTWVLPAPGGPHIDPMNLAIRGQCTRCYTRLVCWLTDPRGPFVSSISQCMVQHAKFLLIIRSISMKSCESMV